MLFRSVEIEDILSAADAGKYTTAQFISEEGESCTLTYDQLNQERYYFLRLLRNSTANAELVPPIIALLVKEDSQNTREMEETAPMLILGQSTISEHTNSLFITGITCIKLSNKPVKKWGAASTWPFPGELQAGDTIKLQHEFFNQVKIFFTLDGSDPTPLSDMYNPGISLTELNKPLVFNGNVTIKTLVTGYGKENSDIAMYEFYLPVNGD